MLALSFAAAYALFLRRNRPPFLQAAGFVPAEGAARRYALGFVAGFVPVVLLIGALVLAGARHFEVRASGLKLAGIVGKYLLLGLPLAAMEEGLFRGLILGDLTRFFRARTAIVAASAFFAATHFLGASPAWRAIPDPNPAASDVLAALFGGLERMGREWPELVGLFLVGVMLSILRLRTGTLWLGMGIHASWYWVKGIDRWFVQEVEAVVEPNQIWLGTSQYVDGVLGWLALLGTLLLVVTLRLPGAPLPDRSSPDYS